MFRPLRPLERRLRAGGMRLALRLLGGRDAPIPDWDARPWRVLFIRHEGLGDMIVCTGMLRAITSAHPSMVVDVLTKPNHARALDNLPFIHDVIPHGRGGRHLATLYRIRLQRYDVVIDGRIGRPSVNWQLVRLMLATGARWRVGTTGRMHDFMYNVPVAPPVNPKLEHHVEQVARLAAPFGVGLNDADWRPIIVLTPAERKVAGDLWRRVPGVGNRVLVNLSAGLLERRWPDDRFSALLEHLRRRLPNVPVAVVALPEERASAEQLARRIGAVAVMPDVRELFGLVEAADLVVSPDTAVTHVASAFGRPTLALMRWGVYYETWAPYRTPGRNVYGDDELTLAGLPTERVVCALDEVLQELGWTGRGDSLVYQG